MAFHMELTEHGMNSSFMMQALHLYLGGLKEVAIVGPENHTSTKEMLQTVRREFFPNAVFAYAPESKVSEIAKDIPLLKGKTAIDGQATAYVCRQGTCLAPVTSVEKLIDLLRYDEWATPTGEIS